MSGKIVLVIDDEPHVRHMLTFKLRGAGFRVLAAGSGEEGWSLAQHRLPDLIITDFQMYQLSGLELCRRLAEHPQMSEIPVIMLTARGHRLTGDDFSGANIQSITDKPFSARELVRTVCDILGEEAGGDKKDRGTSGADAA